MEVVVVNPLGLLETALPAAACRAGALGVLDFDGAGSVPERLRAVKDLARRVDSSFGVKLRGDDEQLLGELLAELPERLDTVILTTGDEADLGAAVARLRERNMTVLLEVTSAARARVGARAGVGGLIAKGHEAGGRVGMETTFILLQELLTEGELPLWVQGGVGLHSAPACIAAGAVGVVLDSQLMLARESPLPEEVRSRIAAMDGSETVCLGQQLGERYRCYYKPGSRAVEELREIERQLAGDPREAAERLAEWRREVADRTGWESPEANLLLLGQDAAFAAHLAERFSTVRGVVEGVRAAIRLQVDLARRLRPLDQDAPLARSHGIRYPILQGPMTRVSDIAEFAANVADAGGLPFLALALLRGGAVSKLLKETQSRLQDKPWGVGILGFVPLELRSEQIAAILENRPPCALIAGGRPDQARVLERAGIPTYLHVPSPGLLELFLKDGARRFVFEGRECGGHVGPRTSFILWSQMIEVLLRAVAADGRPEDFHVVFAGGVHDALSSSMVAVMAAPLAERGVRVGVLMGSAYLFTEEAVASGAIVKGFQEQALACDQTVLLESGPGHETRCVGNAFTETFEREKRRLFESDTPAEEIRTALETLNLGRLRIASKGLTRDPNVEHDAQASKLVALSEAEQVDQGMYMIGQLATLRRETCTIQQLHHSVAVEGSNRLQPAADDRPAAPPMRIDPAPCEVAITGMACLLPKASDMKAYWENILHRVDAITEVPQKRWDWRLYYDAEPSARDKIYSKWGGFIDEITFDPMAYGMPPASLPSIEPAQLLTLEVVRAALEDAGYHERPFPRDHTAVILGAGGGAADLGLSYGARAFLPRLDELPGIPLASREIIDRFGGALPEWTEDSFAGILTNVAAGRVSNRFDLGGGNYTVDAACASSLAAVSMAVKELESGTSDMVIVGGVDTMQNPFTYLCFSKTHALSPRGRCRTFDETADGIVISEGIGIMILKRLADAERDGDRIYAVIKGVGNSSDGKDKGLTAPRPEGQMRALRRAYARAGVSPATVGLIEAHGTGTVAGDQAEVRALSRVFADAGAAPQSCAIGSVKSMIGHTKCTAGVAGLLKTVAALHHKVLPPTLGVDKPNTRVNFPETPFYVNKEARPWMQADGLPRRAGVSAFGFGGTNFHVVLEEYTGGASSVAAAAQQRWPSELFLWEADSPQQMADTVEQWRLALARGSTARLRDLARTLWTETARAGGSAGDKRIRLAVVADSLEDLEAKLGRARKAIAETEEDRFEDPRGIYLAARPLAEEGKVAFLFPGQGSQHPNMLRDLAIQFPEVRSCFEQADGALSRRLEKPLSGYVFPPPAFTPEEDKRRREELTQTHVAQPAIGAASMAMTRLLAELGVRPDLAAGHSYGEYVALWAAGVFEDEALIALSEARGRYMLSAADAEPGTMAVARASAALVRDCLEGLADVCLANINAPEQTVISGTRAAVEEALEILEAKSVGTQRLPVACAFHSPIVASAQEPLAEFLSTLQLSRPRMPVYSNTTTAPHSEEPGEIAAQLVEHVLRPVDFVAEVEAMYAAGARIFVEVGPRNILSGLTEKILADRPRLVVASDHGGRSGLVQLMHLLGRLAVEGVPVVLDRLYRGRDATLLDPATLEGEVAEPPPTAWRISGARATPLRQATGKGSEAGRADQPSSRSAAESGRAPMVAEPERSSRETPPGRLLDEAEPARDRAGRPSAEAPEGSGMLRGAVAAAAAPAGSPGGPSPAVPDGVEDVMAQFQQTMMRFIDTQRRVMLTYLEGSPGAELSEGMPQVLPVGESAVAAQLSAGVGSASEDRRTAPEPEARPAAIVDVSSPPSAERPDAAALGAKFLEIVSERTGYPPDMLDLKLDLEADLGIDSIKRVEILGNFQESVGTAFQAEGEEMMEKLADVKTLGGIIDWIEESVAAQSERVAEQAAPSGQPPMAAQEPSAAELTERLLAVVSERTGYPPEMLRLDLNLEADLGIDSIKRVEILGNFQESLGATTLGDPEKMMEKLAGVKTLGGIVEWLETRLADAYRTEEDGGEALRAPQPPAEPEEGRGQDPAAAGEGARDDLQIGRYTLTPVEAPLREAAAGLGRDRVVVVTDDGRELAATLADELRRRGHPVALVRIGGEAGGDAREGRAAGLGSPEEAEELLKRVRRENGSIGALVHLLPLAPVPAIEDMDLTDWRDRVDAETKSLYLLARAASTDLKEAAAAGGGCLLAATAMGKAWSTGLQADDPEGFPGQGGIHGLLKTLALEWPEVRVKAVDLDLGGETATLAGQLRDELFAEDGNVAVGYRGGRRLILQPQARPFDEAGSEGIAIDSSSVVLVTGGARGVTADVACYLAERYRPRLVLLGRSPLPEARESPETAGLTELQEIKAALIAGLRRSGEEVSPARVEADYNRLLRDREMRAKLAAMEQAGAEVQYHPVDVRDSGALGRLIDEVYAAFGRLDGVIHGAGVIEDKLIEDKTPESFARVFETKAESAFLLSQQLRPEGLKFLVLFSSVAGCFGNRGQADYAAANEVLNALARRLDRRWPARVVAINWGPWARAGMVSAALEEQFAERGVLLIPNEVGQRMLDEELRRGRKGEPQVIIGGAGWQAFGEGEQTASTEGLPLISAAAFARSGADGREELSVTLDAARDLYLKDHQIDARPVLPMAVAMELMAETVAGRFPELEVTGVRELKVLQGVVLENGPKALRVVMHHNGNGGDGVRRVPVQIVAAEPPSRVHYQAAVELDHRLPDAPTLELPSRAELRSYAKQADELYRDWLFHGLLFQGITRIDTLDRESVSASLIPSSPERWFAGPAPGQWLIDPLMIDSGLQLLMVWARENWSTTPLPSRFQTYRRFGSPRDAQMRCEVRIRPTTRGQIIHADLYFLDSEGRLLGMLEDMEGTCSKALNRLASDPNSSAAR